MVDRALAEVPRALRQIGLLDELEDLAVAAPGQPVLVMRTLGGDVLGVEGLAQEVVHRLGLADGGRTTPGAADRVLGRHVATAVGLALVLLGLADHLVRDAARMGELEALGPEAFDLSDLDAGVGQAIAPEADRLGGNGEVDRLRLVGPALAHPTRLAVRERGQDGARVADAVGVVQVVDRDLAVEEHRLLDALEAQRADVEVVVLLRAADTEGQVVRAFDGSWIGHRLLLLESSSVRPIIAGGVLTTFVTNASRNR